ncbi:hypothetical protein GN958_ATG20320 [Phytophthora infestans]|uniref:Uncharacterized protein n=1 Tax=Phytophthora infestans TaxID=4787 RepID=A0A8S9TNC9_PHYIN|nr:hypothetical protein GN958_ATG20320 [Phytophthora infestans]
MDLPPVQLNRTLRANIRNFFVEDKALYFQSDPDSARRLSKSSSIGHTWSGVSNAKFVHRPIPVLKLTTPDTYQVQLPPGLKLHNELHISCLRPYEFDANPRRLNDVPRLLTREGHEGFQVRRILDRRVLKGMIQYKVRSSIEADRILEKSSDSDGTDEPCRHESLVDNSYEQQTITNDRHDSHFDTI